MEFSAAVLELVQVSAAIEARVAEVAHWTALLLATRRPQVPASYPKPRPAAA